MGSRSTVRTHGLVAEVAGVFEIRKPGRAFSCCIVLCVFSMAGARCRVRYRQPTSSTGSTRLRQSTSYPCRELATFAVISIGSFTDSRAPVASRRGKHRWHLAPVLPPSIFRCFRETHVASPSTHQLGHRRLRQLHAQHIGASRPTALRRHRRECGWKARRSVDREGAKPVDVSRRRSLSRNARVPRPAGE